MQKQKQWIVLFTKYRCEKKLYQQLKDDGYEVSLPLYTSIRQWSDRKKKIKIPLISCVVFLKEDPNNLTKIYQYPLVRGILKEFGKPAIVRDEEIKNLEIIANEWDENLIQKNDKIEYHIGDFIEIINGPFKGLNGILIEKNNKNRVVVQIKSLGIEFIINILEYKLKKLDN
jgi:transcription antitermination factor NusG